MLASLKKDIRVLANPGKAKLLQRFFKTGKGEYAEGDIFLGISVPALRTIARQYKNLPLKDVEALLTSLMHEERLIALLLLVENFRRGDEEKKKEIFDFYLSHTEAINNWDLVDLSAGNVVGEWLRLKKDYGILDKLAHSQNLWERRIAIISTFAFIYAGEDSLTYHIAELLLPDKSDLIQKAVGWMLREAGKRVSQEREEDFLRKHYKIMGRTALRYAIERFPEGKRQGYLKGRI